MKVFELTEKSKWSFTYIQNVSGENETQIYFQTNTQNDSVLPVCYGTLHTHTHAAHLSYISANVSMCNICVKCEQVCSHQANLSWHTNTKANMLLLCVTNATQGCVVAYGSDANRTEKGDRDKCQKPIHVSVNK